MASRVKLLEVTYHDDTETGDHRVGEVDFGISGGLYKFLERFGRKGKEEILSTLAFLICDVETRFKKLEEEQFYYSEESVIFDPMVGLHRRIKPENCIEEPSDES